MQMQTFCRMFFRNVTNETSVSYTKTLFIEVNEGIKHPVAFDNKVLDNNIRCWHSYRKEGMFYKQLITHIRGVMSLKAEDYS